MHEHILHYNRVYSAKKKEYNCNKIQNFSIKLLKFKSIDIVVIKV